jgi:hypothetical protein
LIVLRTLLLIFILERIIEKLEPGVRKKIMETKFLLQQFMFFDAVKYI